MARKQKSRRREPKRRDAKPVVFSPFQDLKKMLAGRIANASAPASKKAAMQTDRGEARAASKPIDEEALLREALAGVKPLNGAARVPLERKTNRAIVSEDDEVIAQLSDLVSGQAPFDITETDEYVEGMRVGLDPRLLSQLRRGEFAMQSHIDLHEKARYTDLLVDALLARGLL